MTSLLKEHLLCLKYLNHSSFLLLGSFIHLLSLNHSSLLFKIASSFQFFILAFTLPSSQLKASISIFISSSPVLPSSSLVKGSPAHGAPSSVTANRGIYVVCEREGGDLLLHTSMVTPQSPIIRPLRLGALSFHVVSHSCWRPLPRLSLTRMAKTTLARSLTTHCEGRATTTEIILDVFHVFHFLKNIFTHFLKRVWDSGTF